MTELMKKEQTAAVPSPRAVDPFDMLRAEMDRVFDGFFGRPTASFFPTRFATLPSAAGFIAPHMDVRETDTALVIEAELPGLAEKDVDLTIADGVLTIKGEKTFEQKDERENYHMAERRYGSFSRALRLPDSVDAEKVAATFEKGVLTVTMPKRPEAKAQHRKIAIQAK